MNKTLGILCPEALLRTGNELAACTTGNPADLKSHIRANVQDADGNRYSWIEAQVPETWVQDTIAAYPLPDPGFGWVEEVVVTPATDDALAVTETVETPFDMTAVNAMLAGLANYQGQEDFTVPTDKLTISLCGMPPSLTRIPDDADL